MALAKIIAAVLITVSAAVTVYGVCTAPGSGITKETHSTTFYRYAHCFDHLTPDHFTDVENKQGITQDAYRWPKGVIPYTIDPAVSAADVKVIKSGIQLIQNSTCLRYIPRTVEINYVVIRSNYSGCFSRGVGMRGGAQELNLESPGCNIRSTAAHELLHAAGLYHEHARADRDDYIYVDFSNICKENQQNYIRCDQIKAPLKDGCNSYGFPYNVKSIMHYMGLVSDPAYAVNTSKPIMTSRDPKNPIPQTDNDMITVEDAGKINTMYNNCK